MAPTFSVIICTRNRPDQLATAIDSVLASTAPPFELIVTDDSTDSRTRALVQQRYPAVHYLEGPRKGLGANRNAAIAIAQGDRIVFIDDDVVMVPDFLVSMGKVVQELGANASTTIVTGSEINRGTRVFPHRVSFMGYQAIDYQPGDAVETVVINSSAFPRELFETTRFDESLVYGCDEMDITGRAVRLRGYQIQLVEAIANQHFPASANRDFYTPFLNASRIYVTYKRYRWVEGRRLKAAAFLGIAYAHMAVYYLKTLGLKGISAWRKTIWTSLGYIRTCARDTKRYV